jgi:hypothetical protein
MDGFDELVVHKNIVHNFTLGRKLGWRRFIAHAPKKSDELPTESKSCVINQNYFDRSIHACFVPWLN